MEMGYGKTALILINPKPQYNTMDFYENKRKIIQSK